jgi:RHH-type transcriptional regulator, proline utilization regulon repressor / proline dehydrogenase / delta 1-pyrroline-5-carboxylate dehydrogenase
MNRATHARTAISSAYRENEAQCVERLINEWRATAPDIEKTAARAAALARQVRRQRKGAGGVDKLMHEFSLSSQEGIALMCMAEALLRIPDAATRDRLIRDKIGHGDWKSHLGQSDSLFVNAATWGLVITGKLVGTHSRAAMARSLSEAIGRGGEPLIRRGVEFTMAFLGNQFVMGETIAAALRRSQKNIKKGYAHSFDMLGEAAMTMTDAERYYQAYANAIQAIGQSSSAGVIAGPGISVKLSALHPRYTRSQRDRVMQELYPRLLALATSAADHEMGLNIDAEEADRLELSLDLIDRLAMEPALLNWLGLGVVVQAYQKRAPLVIDHLAGLARRRGRRMMVRLVKGAYWDTEIKRAQVDGLPGYPVFTRKPHTDLSYLVCAARLLDQAEVLYPQFATHNAHTVAAVEQLAFGSGITDYEFQCLHGMGEALYDQPVSRGEVRCRIYAPVGRHETLLPYLVRRLLENGANSSFVNRIVDERVSIAELVADPLREAEHSGGRPHPAIPLPRDLYGAGRINAAGLDLSDENNLHTITAQLARLQSTPWQAAPIVAGQQDPGQEPTRITNPAQRSESVGTAHEANPETIAAALAAAHGYAATWFALPTADRAGMLCRSADLFEARKYEFISLCVREAGKTWSNAVAEIREAVDFFRYYADQAHTLALNPDHASLQPPGVAVCISPWNFPLAIFSGQISAALAAGSTVVAKPAEQTPLIAALAVQLMHQAGIPPAALQLLPGRGETVGAALTRDPRVNSVIFTGSTEVAKTIQQALAQRPSSRAQAAEVRLIAETGGQNAMIVDSSALTEQVVQDVIASAFDSAGQRCSALRILCLQEEIADGVTAMLKAAIQELTIGNTADLATDIGPVIDDDAKRVLEAHIASMRGAGLPVYQPDLPAGCSGGSFVPPTLIEMDRIDRLTREVFGPVVHVIRYASKNLDRLIDAINATGYGLTFGLHSRIDETIAHVTQRIRAGNIYVNRNMVGAVVGVQPFGGEGLSGTGPKAGGPFYVPHLAGLANPDPLMLGLARVKQQGPATGLEAFTALSAWAHRQGLKPLVAACARYAAATVLPLHGQPPGPTGEENTITFKPRGVVECAADSDMAWLLQVAATVSTGNTPQSSPIMRDSDLVQKLPAEVRQCVAWREAGQAPPAAAILFNGDRQTLAELRRKAAKQPGPLIPVITTDAGGFYPLFRLVHERVRSVNTTAAGGNASLMVLA